MLKELSDFDAFMETLVRDWNVPGIGVSILKDEEVLLAKGYGYRDHAQKLPLRRLPASRLRRTQSCSPPWRRACWSIAVC
ncbi:hypothetical protein [Caballeronia sp. LjRoot31]|jgi:CubicO group peptidase (beta-lactamase class C family)|uniref:hypothetical protein n=1 Tax=Caballeronia sp. LjRoot31 TaxID=3342324 RepID=UPI003ECD6B04